MSNILKREFTVLPNLHEEARHCPSQLQLGVMLQLCAPEGSVAPEDWAEERWEFEFFDEEEADADSDRPEGMFSNLSQSRASSSSSPKGNTRGSQGVWGCQRTERTYDVTEQNNSNRSTQYMYDFV